MGARIIDNRRTTLAGVIRELAPKHEELSIATGYWDLPALQLVFEAIRDYKSVRLLIGQEPLPPQYVSKLDIYDLDETFPETQMISNLMHLEPSEELRNLIVETKALLDSGRLQVKIYRGSFLHAKAYIFGNRESLEAVGIIGSSNFTRAGLTSNIELNALEDETRIVKFQPQIDTDEHGHLSWFEEIWSSEKSEKWDGKFRDVLESSPVGDKLFSPYLMYVRALYEIYGDELVPDTEISRNVEDVLYDFQLRNAKLLLKKLKKYGLAMLADSVGLGKTITAGAVVSHYLSEYDARRVYIIAPASLTYQWREDLAKVHGLYHGFEVISMQDIARIRAERAIDKYAGVDLFVVDEAHNLRSGVGTRHDEILEWFSDNPESDVLLLTATPINNSLTDFVNQIQLAAKGKLESFPVVFPTSKKTEVIDFFEAVKRLTKEINIAEKAGRNPDFVKVNRVMRQGLRHFLVRTTRNGIEREFGGITLPDGSMIQFPESHVIPTPYEFSPGLLEELSSLVQQHSRHFGQVKPEQLNIRWLLELTQRAEHPFDSITPDAYESQTQLSTPFEKIFQILLMLGFAPYKTEIYKHKFYKKGPEEIRTFKLKSEESFKVNSQLSIHNMLRVTFLKRLESSQFALKKSLQNYLARLDEFESILLAQNSIATLKDIRNLKAEYGDDLDSMDALLSQDDLELIPADPEIFNIKALKEDLTRDRHLIALLIQMCDVLGRNDDKLSKFASLLERLRKEQQAGKKVLVFSYYADTISYLEENLKNYYSQEDLSLVAEFTSGKTKSQIEVIAKRFSPLSKGGLEEVEREGEIDILFATDVLSEGQNLQDCGQLINFDLHWNPVRMIQRNGRVNRLGSSHREIFLYNIHPDLDLEEYLELVNRLERKIDRIRFTVGTDQSVLGEDANPIEYVDDIDAAVTDLSKSLSLYETEAASKALKELDDSQDLMSEDEFVMDLRIFEKDASTEQREELRRIPDGKWGQLTTEGAKKVGNPQSLALMRVRGTISGSGEEFENHIFVSGAEFYGPVETMSALAALRVDPTYEHETSDQIRIDRNRVAKRSRQVAKSHSVSSPSFFRVTPTVTSALDAAKRQSPELELHEALKKISTKQENRRARKLIGLANRDLKQLGVLSSNTLTEMLSFTDLMAKKSELSKEISDDGIRGVLYFGR